MVARITWNKQRSGNRFRHATATNLVVWVIKVDARFFVGENDDIGEMFDSA